MGKNSYLGEVGELHGEAQQLRKVHELVLGARRVAAGAGPAAGGHAGRHAARGAGLAHSWNGKDKNQIKRNKSRRVLRELKSVPVVSKNRKFKLTMDLTYTRVSNLI